MSERDKPRIWFQETWILDWFLIYCRWPLGNAFPIQISYQQNIQKMVDLIQVRDGNKFHLTGNLETVGNVSLQGHIENLRLFDFLVTSSLGTMYGSRRSPTVVASLSLFVTITVSNSRAQTLTVSLWNGKPTQQSQKL